MYSPDSLHTWLTTRRSKYPVCVCLKFTLTPCAFNRVLLACVRSLGACPCPRCFIKKEDIPGLGTQVDGQRRAEHQKGDHVYRHKIETAQEIIYKKGYVVNSKAVDGVIGSESFTPTRVSWLDIWISTLLLIIIISKAHSFQPFLSLGWTFSPSSLWISYTNLSWVFGRPCLHTLSESSIHRAQILLQNLIAGK